MDRSFVITDSLSHKGTTPNIPSPVTLKAHKQWTAQEVEETRCIVELHIHVERAIGRIKILNPINSKFTQPFTATHSLHGPHLLPVQEVCPKGLTQLLHYLLVAIASCKQNCSPAILREGGKSGLHIKWVLVW